jgi:hypothetical protein
MLNISPETWRWWQSRRRRYNVALIVSGLLAFFCLAGVIELCLEFRDQSKPTEMEITAFTIVFQGLGYLMMMGVANICYTAGPLAEAIVKPSDVERFRSQLFAAGFWFSFALPFSVPIMVAVLCLKYGA